MQTIKITSQNYNTNIYEALLQSTYSPIHSLYKCIDQMDNFKSLKFPSLFLTPSLKWPIPCSIFAVAMSYSWHRLYSFMCLL